MGFEQAVASCLRKYANTRGRASRSEFWWFYLFAWSASFAAALLSVAFANAPGISAAVVLFSGAVRIGLLIPVVAASVRRLHDTDRSGWWIAVPFLLLVPLGIMFNQEKDLSQSAHTEAIFLFSLLLLGVLVLLLVWLCMKGTMGVNRFGPDPLDGLRDKGGDPVCTNCGSLCRETTDGLLFCGSCGFVYQRADFQKRACPSCGAQFRPADYRKGEAWTCSSCGGSLPQSQDQVPIQPTS